MATLENINFHRDIPITKVATGKVREIFSLEYQGEEQLLLVATDRLSAFDFILPNLIPQKGAILTKLSLFWFDYFSQKFDREKLSHHLITADIEEYPDFLQPYRSLLEGRSMIVKKAKPLPVECIVRGYLTGGAWREYQELGTVWGKPLSKGLQESQRLPERLFTPTTKAAQGHDEPLSWEDFVTLLGKNVASKIREKALSLYQNAASLAESRGVLIADTKMEFGCYQGDLILIDECFTPDSSRFWLLEQWAPGSAPPCFDKQLVRNYLLNSGWNRQTPVPTLPEEIVHQTTEHYQKIFQLLTGDNNC